jgi:hypothetical protein
MFWVWIVLKKFWGMCWNITLFRLKTHRGGVIFKQELSLESQEVHCVLASLCLHSESLKENTSTSQIKAATSTVAEFGAAIHPLEWMDISVPPVHRGSFSLGRFKGPSPSTSAMVSVPGKAEERVAAQQPAPVKPITDTAVTISAIGGKPWATGLPSSSTPSLHRTVPPVEWHEQRQKIRRREAGSWLQMMKWNQKLSGEGNYCCMA